MLFHGKALEVYTAAYQNIQKIDEEEDLEVGFCLLSLVLLLVSIFLKESISLFG